MSESVLGMIIGVAICVGLTAIQCIWDALRPSDYELWEAADKGVQEWRAGK